ncbi:MAG: chitobiase/beta-hexosaminidase C-terminal domain-containing protein, partial [Bacteroidales bacterium]|nr:chitobiase/beta-hexosaminidase C-terminal domain-containing protein [Bacteroidales bacterium]
MGLDNSGDGTEIMWVPGLTIPAEAQGVLYLHARLADNSGNEVVYSTQVDITYMVQGEVAKPDMPTFSPASGTQVDPGTTVTISAPGADYIFYTTTEQGEPSETTWLQYNTPITINKAMTIRAAAANGQMPPFTFSDVATATYTVTDKERTDVPKLTVTPAGPIEIDHSVTFSCALDPQQYTHALGKVGFGIQLKNGAGVEKLEYQVGDEVDPNDWTEYSEASLRSLKGGTAVLAAIPVEGNANSENARVIAIEAKTVHYRLTLPAGAADPEVVFSAVELTAAGAWTAESEVIAETSVKFENVAAPEAPTFVPEAGEVAFGTMVELECETASATIYFTVDGTEPTAESEEYSFFSEILITKAMTVKAIAVWNGHSSAVVEAAYTV